MDKFVIRGKRELVQDDGSKNRGRPYQARLESLKGVVVVEDLEKAKDELKNPETSHDRLLQVLKQLKQKKPSKEILKSTGLGKVVHRLSRHDNPEVARKAGIVYQSWKSHLLTQLNRKPIKVAYDEETCRTKESAIKLFYEALGNKHRRLAEDVEEELFKSCKQIMNATYKRAVRKIHFLLKSDPNLREKLYAQTVSVNDFVQDVLRDIKKVYCT